MATHQHSTWAALVLLAAAQAFAPNASATVVIPSTTIVVQTSAAVYDRTNTQRLSYSHDVQTGTASLASNSGAAGAYADQGYTADGVMSLDWHATALGTASGIAHYGDLHALASASMNYLPASISYVSETDNRIWYNPLYPGAGASSEVGFYDMLSFDTPGHSLPRGTQVTVKFSLFLDSSVVGCDPYDQFRGAKAMAGFGVEDYFQYSYFGYVGTTASLTNTGCDARDSRETDYTMTVTAGRAYVLHDYLTALANLDRYECSSDTCGQKTYYADASNTSLFYIDILTPDVVLTSESGHNYATPTAPSKVPEPGSLALALGALLAAVAVRRRSRV